MTAAAAPQRTAWKTKKHGFFGWFVVDATGETICSAATQADAELIVLTANSHAALVEALEKVAGQFCESDDCFASADARAALALAKGEQS